MLDDPFAAPVVRSFSKIAVALNPGLAPPVVGGFSQRAVVLDKRLTEPIAFSFSKVAIARLEALAEPVKAARDKVAVHRHVLRWPCSFRNSGGWRREEPECHCQRGRERGRAGGSAHTLISARTFRDRQ